MENGKLFRTTLTYEYVHDDLVGEREGTHEPCQHRVSREEEGGGITNLVKIDLVGRGEGYVIPLSMMIS